MKIIISHTGIIQIYDRIYNERGPGTSFSTAHCNARIMVYFEICLFLGNEILLTDSEPCGQPRNTVLSAALFLALYKAYFGAGLLDLLIERACLVWIPQQY